MLKQFIFLFLLGVSCFGQQWTQKGTTISGATGDLSSYMSMNATGEFVVVGAPYNSHNGHYAGMVRVLQFTNGDWNQIGQEIYGESAEDQSGLAVSINDDGTLVAIGSRYNKSNGVDGGQVRIYKYNGTAWEQVGQNLNGPEKSYYGTDVEFSANGNRIIIGAHFDSPSTQNSGMVEVFDLVNNSWTQVGQTLYGDNDKKFGFRVDINDAGNVIAGVSMQGKAKIFQLDGNTWIQTGYFTDSYQEVSLNSDGTVVALGDAFNSEGGFFSGKAQVFKYQDGDWVSLGNPFIGTVPFGYVGGGLSLNDSGDILAVGTQNVDNGKGKVNLYKFFNNTWNPLGNELNGELDKENFGFNVKLNKTGDVLSVGSLNGAVVKVFDYHCDLVAPSFTETISICEGSTALLTVDANGNTVSWYDSENATTPVFVGESFETSSLNQDTTYWAAYSNDFNCNSTRTAVQVKVLAKPVLNLETTNVTACYNQTTNLYASSPNNVIFWYANENDQDYLYHGNLFVTPTLTQTTTYWVEAYNITTGCRSERVEVTVNVLAEILKPVAETNQEFSVGQTLNDLVVTHEHPIKWFADEYLTIELESTTELVDNYTYYVVQFVGNCISEAVAVTVKSKNLGINDQLNQEIVLYPNPTTDFVHLEIPSTIKSVKYEIYSALGEKISEGSTNNKTKISLKNFGKGFYIMKLVTENNESITKKILVK